MTIVQFYTVNGQEPVVVAMVRMLHTADLHLGRTFSSWGEPVASAHREDLLRTLEQIGKIAVAQAIPLLLIAGDLFDVHNPEPALVATVRGWFSRLADQNIQVAIVPGNHDSYWYERSVYREAVFPANTHVFREATCSVPITLRIDGSEVNLYGIAHDHTRDRHPIESLRRRSGDGLHIGLLHATVDPPPGFAVEDRYLPLTSDDLRATGLDYVALGHIHRHQVFNQAGPAFASQPGSPEPLAVDETGQRTINIVSIDENSARIERVSVGMRTAYRRSLDCSGMNQIEITCMLRELSGPDCILDAVLVGTPDESVDADVMQRELAGAFCYLSLTDHTDIADSAFARAIEHEQTIRGRFVRALRARALAASSDEERQVIEMALKRGLVALAKRSVP